MSYTYTDCYSSLTKAGLTPCDTPASSITCTTWKAENQGTVISVCSGTDPYVPIQAVVCRNSGTNEIQVFPPDTLITGCLALQKQDANWNFYQCYCCCFDSMQANIVIANASGGNQVHEMQTGHAVLVGSLHTTGIVWSPATLDFCNSMKSSGSDEMLTLNFGDNQKMTCTPDHLVMLTNQKLKQVAALQLTDVLLGANGTAVKINTLELSTFQGTIYQLATTTHFDRTPNGHLVNTNGIVCGDYTLQIHFDQLNPAYKA